MCSTCKQLAFVLPTSESGPTNFNSFNLLFKKSQDSSPASLLQHFGFVWSEQRKIWRVVLLIPNSSPSFVARSPASTEDDIDDDMILAAGLLIMRLTENDIVITARNSNPRDALTTTRQPIRKDLAIGSNSISVQNSPSFNKHFCLTAVALLLWRYRDLRSTEVLSTS